MTLSARLQAATREPHDRIEALPLSQAMAAGRIGRGPYLALLGQLRHLHEELEPLLAARAELAPLFGPGAARAEDLARDVLALAGWPVPVPPLPEAAAYCDRLRRWAVEGPAALAGALYVFEGSRMGSMMLARPLGRALGVPPEPGCGLDYHVRDLAGRVPEWRRFKAALDALPLTEAEQQAAVDAASETFEALARIYERVGGMAEGAGAAGEPAAAAAGGAV